jgi:cyclic nucleotide gated channel beta 1
MVYPEKLSLDQVVDKSSSTSWCGGPLERYSKINITHSAKKKSAKSADREKSDIREQNRSPSLENVPPSMSANRQFIQDRIRHLVDAFSTRAQAARERMETPATPSSISSRETVEPTPVPYKPKLSSASDKSVGLVPQTKPKSSSLYKNLKYLWDNKIVDPNGKVYIIWMSIAAIAVMYNAWVIPLRSTFPYQTPENRPIWMAFDYVADFVYMIDMILIQPRVKYLNEGFWVTDMAQLRHNYMKKKAFKVINDAIVLLRD